MALWDSKESTSVLAITMASNLADISLCEQ